MKPKSCLPRRDGSRHASSGLGILLAGFAGITMLAGITASPMAAPQAQVVEPAHIEAGEVEPGDVLHYTFTLRNTGDALLAIEDLQPTCYCTTAKTDLWDVPPGGAAHIQVRIDPSDFVGPVNKGVEISTNDPDNPMLLVDVDLIVRPGIAVVPPELDFGDVPEDGSRSQQVAIKAPRERAFEVKKVTSDVPWLEAEAEPLELEERVGATVYVKVMPGVPAGPFQGHVVVHTTDPARPTIDIPVRGRGPGGLAAAPARVTFAMAAAGADVGSFEVSGAAQVEVRSTSESLVATLEPGPDGHHVVKLKLAPQARAGRLLAKVIVSDPSGGLPDLAVPVMGIVR